MIDFASKKPYAQSGPKSCQCELLSCLTGSCKHRQLLSHTCLTQRLRLTCAVFFPGLPSQTQKLELQMFIGLTSAASFFGKGAHLDFSTLFLSSTGLVSVQDNNFLEKIMCALRGQSSKQRNFSFEAWKGRTVLYAPGYSF